MLSGVYVIGLSIDGVTAAPYRIVATGATVGAQTAISVTEGASVEIRGVSVSASQQAVSCSSSTAAVSKLTIRDSMLSVASTNANLVAADNNCNLTLSGTELDIGASSGGGLILTSNATVTVDRCHMRGTSSPFSLGVIGSRASLTVTTSVLENIDPVWIPSDTTTPGSAVLMGFNTIHMDEIPWNCRPISNVYWKARYDNNIFVGSRVASAVEGTDCTLANNVLHPYTSAAGTNTVADPQFVDEAARNYRLKSTSPAIDIAVPTAGLLSSVDFDGTARPQGAQIDVGAFEFKP
jgi:hypothetical protein